MRLLCPLVGHLIAAKGFEMRKLEDGDSEILIFVSSISLSSCSLCRSDRFGFADYKSVSYI